MQNLVFFRLASFTNSVTKACKHRRILWIFSAISIVSIASFIYRSEPSQNDHRLGFNASTTTPLNYSEKVVAKNQNGSTGNKSADLIHASKLRSDKTLNSTQKSSANSTRGIALLKASPTVATYETNIAGKNIKTKIIKTELKYPHIRVDSEFSAQGSSNEAYMVADHVVIKRRESATIDDIKSLAESSGYQLRKVYSNSDRILISFNAETPNAIENAKRFFSSYPDIVANVEADHLRFATSISPDDPYFYRQNHLDYVRSPSSKNSQLDNIGARQAWERRTKAEKENGEDVLIGVIDTGIATEHEDLINNIWVNPNEVANNGVDDDGNGFVDDIHGWNFSEDNNTMDDYGGHGTHIAGVIAAEGNNSIGVSGVTWQAKLISADIFGSGITTGADGAEATRYLIDLGVDIINASYGASDYMDVECEAIAEANQAGILFVTAAGNALKNLDIEGNDHYPAECDSDNVIVVGGGSTRLHDLEDGQSNYGAEAVDIIAPIGTFSTYAWHTDDPTEYYSYMEGTSVSAPMVTGAAALLIAEYPEFSHHEIKSLLMDSATRSSPIEDTSRSGMLNVARAINFDVPTFEANIIDISASSDDGNIPSNTVDNDPNTRWSAKGYGQYITFELEQTEVLSAIEIQWLRGDQRKASFSIESSIDGTTWEVIYGGVFRNDVLETSSGKSAQLEYYPVLNVEAKFVRVVGYGNTVNSWTSIIEADIYVYENL